MSRFALHRPLKYSFTMLYVRIATANKHAAETWLHTSGVLYQQRYGEVPLAASVLDFPYISSGECDEGSPIESILACRLQHQQIDPWTMQPFGKWNIRPTEKNMCSR